MPSQYSSSGGSGGGSSIIPEFTSDPVSPTAGQTWILRTTTHSAGSSIGLLLGLTYANDLYAYQLSYFTTESTIVRTGLS